MLIAEIVVAVIVGTLMYWWFNWYTDPLRKLPTNDGFDLLPVVLSNGDEMNGHLELGKQSKEGLLFRRSVFEKHILLISPQHAKRVLTDKKHFVLTNLTKKFLPLFGDGLLTTDGEFHAWQKKKLSTAFTPQQLRKYFVTLDAYGKKLSQKWKYEVGAEDENGKNMVVLDDLTDVTFDIIGEVAFGYQFNSLAAEKQNMFCESFASFTESMTSISRFLMVIFPFLKWLPIKSIQQAIEFDIVAKRTMNEILEKRKQEIEQGCSREDVLTKLLNVCEEDDKKRMSDSLICDNIFTILLAGHETSATGLNWCLYQFSNFLAEQEKAREEIRREVGDCEHITYDNMSKLKFLDLFIKETFRMHSPVSAMMSRACTTNVKFGSYNIPPGCTFKLNLPAIHYDADVYPDPFEFKPERFLGDVPSDCYYVFGYGDKMCLGKNFALLEVKCILAHLLLNFKFTIDAENVAYKKRFRVGLHTEKPLVIRVHKI